MPNKFFKSSQPARRRICVLSIDPFSEFFEETPRASVCELLSFEKLLTILIKRSPEPFGFGFLALLCKGNYCPIGSIVSRQSLVLEAAICELFQSLYALLKLEEWCQINLNVKSIVG